MTSSVYCGQPAQERGHLLRGPCLALFSRPFPLAGPEFLSRLLYWSYPTEFFLSSHSTSDSSPQLRMPLLMPAHSRRPALQCASRWLCPLGATLRNTRVRALVCLLVSPCSCDFIHCCLFLISMVSVICCGLH